MIVENLIKCASLNSKGQRIKDVRAGLGYTCVLLEDGSSGLAYTFRNEMGCSCSILSEAGNLIGKPVEEIIPWMKESHLLKASIGLATINAVVNNRPDANCGTGNVVDVLNIGETDTFGMVGDFKPILMRVKKKTKKIYVFEQNLSKGVELYPEEAIPTYLPQCSVIILTATSIINHTIDNVLSYCQNAREVCLVGPSTPLCPEAFQDYNVTTFAGSVVQDIEKALEIVSQGGGTKSLKSASKQVLVRI